MKARSWGETVVKPNLPTVGVDSIVAADERLVCADGATWRVEKLKDGQRVSEGRLDAPMPLFDGATRLGFSAELAEGETCEVDLLKSYQQ